MSRDLTTSNIDRQNLLNNRSAMENIQRQLDITGMLFDGEYKFTKKMVADYYEVGIATIDRYLSEFSSELKHNGYVLIKGKRLKEFKLLFGHIINDMTKTTQLGIFNFRAFLNIGMLLTESEKAKLLRSRILDIVIATITEKSGGNVKYINRRDANYLPAAIKEINYRRNLTSSLSRYVEGTNAKYSQVTNYIYKAVFRENATEYRKILKLHEKDNVRSTLYAEVLLVISSFENGIADYIEKTFYKNKVKLSLREVQKIVNKFAESPAQKPYLEDARAKMASRDYSLREALHINMQEYIKELSPNEFEKFIGEQSVEFEKILEENKEVLKRLKQGENE